MWVGCGILVPKAAASPKLHLVGEAPGVRGRHRDVLIKVNIKVYFGLFYVELCRTVQGLCTILFLSFVNYTLKS
jgi:hypothetical protein